MTKGSSVTVWVHKRFIQDSSQRCDCLIGMSELDLVKDFGDNSCPLRLTARYITSSILSNDHHPIKHQQSLAKHYPIQPLKVCFGIARIGTSADGVVTIEVADAKNNSAFRQRSLRSENYARLLNGYGVIVELILHLWIAEEWFLSKAQSGHLIHRQPTSVDIYRYLAARGLEN